MASFEWLEPSQAVTGVYSAKDNVLSVLQNLKEWEASDVCAHEFFHNLQHKCPELFNYDQLGQDSKPKPPFEGKLFMEGSAMWAESHIVDALTIRTSLSELNLREGDEYGDGFQILKYIEENHGGLNAVKTFLRTGDISEVTRGEISDLAQLYSRFGLRPE